MQPLNVRPSPRRWRDAARILCVKRNELLSERIDRLVKATRRYSSEREFLRAAGVSEGYLSQFRAREQRNRDASFNTTQATAMAAELGVSVEDLLGTAPLHDTGERYPGLARAIVAARMLNYSEAAIAAVSKETPDVDPGARYWFHRIEAEDDALLRPATAGRRFSP